MEIFEFAWEFIQIHLSENDANKLTNNYNLYKNIELKRRGPKPILKKFNSDDEEQQFICKEINRLVQDERISPNKIAILHPYATSRNAVMIEPYVRQLEKDGIPTYWISKDNVNKINYDPKINYLAISTPDSGKGLEWDIVFMPSLEKYNKENPNNLKFVAAMRARHLLYPSECRNV
jgi:superfamily I DNA/RNA helicase